MGHYSSRGMISFMNLGVGCLVWSYRMVSSWADDSDELRGVDFVRCLVVEVKYSRGGLLD